ncbi:2-keto-4-pentenoate hydratase [Xanthomonas euvesicatoria]|uniref:2-keto-4-pentenoate hydratase n=1 Tax=Xanthomonas citri TaxID=346 RepID=UPI000F803D13|nr:2-keto-4-pentenoate hydratase [Xanthomonas axonopodis]MEE5092100.1 2-keto-4-pentenoate hydratase [Xanthomonas euvesicatoria]RTE55722.1 2-keto-4-pentenoate hydratase [Xanthomonas axonopodis pv. eucalyptorum]
MSLEPSILAEAARRLRDAETSGQFIPPLRETFPGIDADDAYAIQKLNAELKLASGARIVGAKIGLTSLAVQKQLDVDTPDYGLLFDDMSYGEGLPIPVSRLQQPKVEAEVAFVLGGDLSMRNPTIVDVLNAIDYAVPALEIVGSRIFNWNIKLVDTVADNASSSAFVIGGSPKKLSALDLRNCEMRLTRDGETVSTGNGAACLGHPLNAVVWLARTMARVGAPLMAGDLVLSGALGPMVAVEAGKTYSASIEGLGHVTAVFE